MNTVKSIKSTIFNKMVLTVCGASASAIAAMLIIVSVMVSGNIKTEIRTITNHTAEYMNSLNSTEEKLSFLHAMYDNVKDERQTLIAPGGDVLYDSDVNAQSLENHLTRPEVKDAREKGEGETTRSSDTLSKRVFYYAVRLEDGSVIRTAKTQAVMYKTILALIPASLLLLSCIMIGTRKVSYSMTRKIVEPIYKIDINNINKNKEEIYPELYPFLERIEAENAEKEKTEAIRREFSANVSHELKTPLTSISGYAQMINNGMAKPEDVSMFSLKIEKEAERLLLLIDDIIRLSHLDETTVTDTEPVNINEIVTDTVSSLEQQFKRRDIMLYYSGDDCYINGRPSMISELAYNIIDNAIKYNKQGGRIDIYVGTSPEGIELSVSDTGIGIAEEDLDRIFERFYRVDKSHSKTVGGTGLGLSIVKHVVMIHNAKITVKSSPGEGTTVAVYFKPADI